MFTDAYNSEHLIHLPLRPNGDAYPYVLFYDQNRRIRAADLREDLIATFIPRYSTLPYNDNSRLAARYRYNHTISNRLSSILAADPDLNEADRELIKRIGTKTPPGDAEDSERVTTTHLPLILPARYYAPYTTLLPPLGENVVLLEDHTEQAFLESLAGTGIISYIFSEST